MKDCVVVIPIHRAVPSRFELISLCQCFSVLRNYDIKVVAPEGLSISVYKNNVSNLEVIYIDSRWQSSILNYNKLKLSNYFYELFSDYNYLLTYELDSFIFRDELQYWCSLGLDYIGAPWFEGYTNPNGIVVGVGNSGFSLRRIKSIKNGINTINYEVPDYYMLGKYSKIKEQIKYRFSVWANFLFKENLTIQNANWLHEDRVIGDIMSSSTVGFKLASVADAIKFSFEVGPRILYELNNYQLPMGCHAWWRYDLEFWKPFIEKFNYKI